MENARQDPLFQFVWSRPEAGYEIVEAPPDQEEAKFLIRIGAPVPKMVKYLMPVFAPERMARITYRPLSAQTGLFRRFADLDPPEDQAIVAFANEFGSLFDKPVVTDRPNLPDSAGVFHRMGERLSDWRRSIEEISHFVQMWDYIKQNNIQELAKWFRWDGNGREVAYQGPCSQLDFPVVASDYDFKHPNALPVSRFLTGDVLGPARYFLHRQINQHLLRDTRACLLWTEDRKRRENLFVVPVHLRAAMWLQFTKTVVGNKEHRPCCICGTWFEVAANKRADAKFCSDACRSKGYRSAEKAREMRRAGRSIGTIVKQLGFGTKLVKEWLKEDK